MLNILIIKEISDEVTRWTPRQMIRRWRAPLAIPQRRALRLRRDQADPIRAEPPGPPRI